MRQIKYIVIHCTATPSNSTVEAIQRYWKTPPPNGMGWKSPGYHYLISADGGVTQIADETLVTNGVAGYNSVSVHVSYIGGVDPRNRPMDTRTREQLVAMKALVKKLKIKYPKAVIQGHRDFPRVAKACPSFSVKEWLAKEGI